MKKVLLFFLYLFFPLATFAQGVFPSENGLFTANFLKGCVGTTITITPINATGTPFVCFDADLSDLGANNQCFNDQANDPNNPFSFTYQEAGEYNILFLRQLGNNQTYDSLTVRILDPAAPNIALASCPQGLVVSLNAQTALFDLYTINFGDGSPLQQYPISAFPFTYNYADPNQNYTLTVIGEFNNTGNNNCNNDTFTKNFNPAEQNEAAAEINNIELLSENSFEVNYTTNENQIYQIQLKQNSNGNYQTIGNISNSNGGTYTLANLNLNTNFYCVRILAISQCNGQNLLSNEVCTIRFNPNAGIDGNLLDWNHSDFETSNLLKNGEIIYTGVAPFLDTNVLCGQSDIYEIVAIDQNGVEVRSLQKAVEAITGSPEIPITQIATNVLSDSEVEISWAIPDGLEPEQFIIYKKRNIIDDFFEVDSTSQNSYIDVGTAFYERIFYYSIAYTNNCGGISPIFSIAPNMLLQIKQQDSEINLSWNTYTGFDSLFDNYVIKKYDAALNLLTATTLTNETEFSENIAQSDVQKLIYQVEAISKDGLIAFSNLLEYKIPSSFFVPTAFTPNQDGRNEELKVVGKFIAEVELSIYNRWGSLIFRSNSLEEGWDGYLPNREAPEGTYTFTIRVKDSFGEEYYKSGVFNLIR